MSRAPPKRRRRVVREDGPDPIDQYVGNRARELRLQAGLAQPAIAEQLGVSFQAVQKYESASLRISASTLYRLAQIFAVGPEYFFEGYGAPETIRGKRQRKMARSPRARAHRLT